MTLSEIPFRLDIVAPQFLKRTPRERCLTCSNRPLEGPLLRNKRTVAGESVSS
jgi:hypothetical protein